jgi:hypothetical protein
MTTVNGSIPRPQQLLNAAPSKSLSKACCTPSPDTSRVATPIPCGEPILSISSKNTIPVIIYQHANFISICQHSTRTSLRLLDVEVTSDQQLVEHGFNVFANIPSLAERHWLSRHRFNPRQAIPSDYSDTTLTWVREVQSAIAIGTSSTCASVRASNVFPDPVGPTIRMLLFSNWTPCTSYVTAVLVCSLAGLRAANL